MKRHDLKANNLEPNLQQARRTAGVAHNVVVKLKEMGLPEALDGALASLSTDLGDLWGSHKRLNERLESLLKAPHNWEDVANFLVDIRECIDHIAWHQKSIRRPLSKITRYAYHKSSETVPGKENLSG